jgi:membrane AbrB-like protein
LELFVPETSSPFTLGSLPPLAQWALLLAVAAIAGQLLTMVHVPAGRFLGPMVVAIAFAVAGCTVRLPKAAFKGGQSVIGLLASHSISAAVLASLAQAWPIMVAATACTIFLSLFVGVAMARYGDLPGTTAIWGSAPGAASAMISMAEDQGADGRVVATMQYVRVVCVVLSGAFVGHLLGLSNADVHPVIAAAAAVEWQMFAGCLAVIVIGIVFGDRVPAGALLIPLVLGAALQMAGVLTIALPGWFTALAMAAIGGYVGLRFDRPTVLYVLKRLPNMLLCSMLLIIASALLAYVIALLLDKDYLSVYLATSPGGLDSMAIIAVDTQADVSLVMAMQALRLFTVILIGPWLVGKIITLTTRDPAKA